MLGHHNQIMLLEQFVLTLVVFQLFPANRMSYCFEYFLKDITTSLITNQDVFIMTQQLASRPPDQIHPENKPI
jgi:hypothetical protein